MSFVMGFFTKTVETVKVPHLSPFEELEQLRQANREQKARYDAAFAKLIAYKNANKILDAVGFIGENAMVRVGAMFEHPELAKLSYDVALTRQRWAAGRKAVSDLEFAMGVKK